MSKDEHPLIKQIRARAQQQSQAEDARADTVGESGGKHKLHFPRIEGESAVERYKRVRRWTGILDKMNRRFVALALLRERIEEGKHVQNRALQNNLTKAEYQALQAEQERQRRMRAGKNKPDAIKHYEAALNRITLQAVKAKDLAHSGHDAGASEVARLCSSQIWDLLTQLRSAVAKDPALQHWLDRPVPQQHTVTVEQLPRAITSGSQHCVAQRKSSKEVKLDAIKQAMHSLDEQKTQYLRS